MKRKKRNLILETSIEALKKAIFDLHGCEATWAESIPVKEVFEGKTVWKGGCSGVQSDRPSQG